MLAFVLVALAADAPETPEPEPLAVEREHIDAVQMIRGASAWDLDWSDAEDRVHGTIRPIEPVEGRPLELSVLVGTFQGTEFDGAVSMAMRCPEWNDTQTVRRARGERAWFVKFVPLSEGECSIDVGFTTVRHKLLHAKITVAPAPLSRLPWYLILGLSIVTALGLGVRAIFKKPEQA